MTERPSNPVPIQDGPDYHVRKFLHDAFDRHAAQGKAFDPDDWTHWSEEEVAGTIRALAQDYLAGPGKGYDWMLASQRAELVIAATYHEVAHRAGLSPAPRMYINFFDPFMGEGLEVEMSPPSGLVMDPIPGSAPAPAPTNSQRSRAQLTVEPPEDCLEAVDKALWTGANQLSEFFQTHSRLPLIMMGGMLTLWKALQVAHTPRAGIIFRGLRNPERPEVPEGEMRLVYARSGDHVMAAVNMDPDGANLLLA